MPFTQIPVPETEKKLLLDNSAQELDHPAEPCYSMRHGHPVYHPPCYNTSSGPPPYNSQITDHFQPPPQPQPQTTVINTPPRANTAFSRRPSPEVKDYSALALVVTVCCCLPFGLIAYFMASRAKDRQFSGDDDEALTSSRCALGWSIAGIVCGIVLSTLLGLYYYYFLGSSF